MANFEIKPIKDLLGGDIFWTSLPDGKRMKVLPLGLVPSQSSGWVIAIECPEVAPHRNKVPWIPEIRALWKDTEVVAELASASPPDLSYDDSYIPDDSDIPF